MAYTIALVTAPIWCAALAAGITLALNAVMARVARWYWRRR